VEIDRLTLIFCDSFAFVKESLDMVDLGQLHYYVMCVGEFARAKSMNLLAPRGEVSCKRCII
jgi:hypothetical protein